MRIQQLQEQRLELTSGFEGDRHEDVESDGGDERTKRDSSSLYSRSNRGAGRVLNEEKEVLSACRSER